MIALGRRGQPGVVVGLSPSGARIPAWGWRRIGCGGVPSGLHRRLAAVFAALAPAAERGHQPQRPQGGAQGAGGPANRCGSAGVGQWSHFTAPTRVGSATGARNPAPEQARDASRPYGPEGRLGNASSKNALDRFSGGCGLGQVAARRRPRNGSQARILSGSPLTARRRQPACAVAGRSAIVDGSSVVTPCSSATASPSISTRSPPAAAS